MDNLTNKHDIVVIMVPLPAQGHLNQFLQLSCLISSYGIPVHYVGAATYIRQAKSRVNGLNPQEIAKIHFHDFPTPPFATPSPNSDSSDKFPVQLQPAWDATSSLGEPIATFLREMSTKSKRVVVIHDVLMSLVVQDVTSIRNAESYAYNCISAICQAFVIWGKTGYPLPVELQDLVALADGAPEEFKHFVTVQYGYMNRSAGYLHNTTRLIEAQYLDLLDSVAINGMRKNWAIGPLLSAKFSKLDIQHECVEWLDKQKVKSVLYVSFGTTTSLSDEQVEEMALGLEQSKSKFLWVLRDADKGDIFDGEIRRPKLPDGFEGRVKGVGLVVREWAPQPEILAHPSIGGFMSHCGWNSCMESITMGVPIAAWPMHSDQPINAALVTKILETGFLVRDWTQRGEVVKALAVENAVRRLLESEEGSKIRKRAEELGVNVRRATEEGGISRIEFDSFVAHITR